ncbi:hypothetical protein [Larkinella sp. C7]|jgi:predicted neutral ceramidase superfamily lipid hydrolase|uniref:hypothetical protein n=1 Tax=Larkinella sp. C7 TaxID=2576607 RepID=UPI001110FDF5|nr:hypothetical protein [Larkinella sp. C7]
MKKIFKVLLLVAGVWLTLPTLYLYVAFPIMDVLADQLDELSLVVNVAFIGFFSTLVVWGLYRLSLLFTNQPYQNDVKHG